MRGLIGVVAAIGIAIPMSAAPGDATASAEMGSGCVANASEPGVTVVQLAKAAGSSIPLIAPSVGVLTSWTVRVGPEAVIEADPQKLQVFRSQTNPSKLQVIGESAEESIANGGGTFKTRIPILAGDRLGLYGPRGPGTLACDTGATEDEMGVLRAAAALGSVNEFPPVTKFEVPVTATLEPDRDGDGFGDETQDACPQSAAYQSACPVVALRIAAASARTHSIVLRVRASSEATVQVSGQIAWGFQPSRKRSPSHEKPARLVVGLHGGAKTVSPAGATVFRVPLPNTVLRRLGRIGPQRALKAKLTASTTEVDGQLTTAQVTVRLRGRNSGS